MGEVAINRVVVAATGRAGDVVYLRALAAGGELESAVDFAVLRRGEDRDVELKGAGLLASNRREGRAENRGVFEFDEADDHATRRNDNRRVEAATERGGINRIFYLRFAKNEEGKECQEFVASQNFTL